MLFLKCERFDSIERGEYLENLYYSFFSSPDTKHPLTKSYSELG